MCLVNISLNWSFTLSPWRVPCVHKIEVQCLTSFFGYKDQQRTTTTSKNIFHERQGLYNGRCTQLTCLSEVCQALRYDCQFAFHY